MYFTNALKIQILKKGAITNLIHKINKNASFAGISTSSQYNTETKLVTPPKTEPKQFDVNPDPSLRLVRQKYSDPTKLCLIPESWFFFFHEKTGVSGIYTFMITFATFLFSKEIVVMEHEFYNGLSMVLMLWGGVVKVGPGITKYLDEELDQIEGKWNGSRNTEIENWTSMIKNEERNQWSTEGELMLLDAKRENVLLQLEYEYRKRLQLAYETVLRRFKFQLYAYNIQDKYWQQNMAEWIRAQVLKVITPEWDTKNFDVCINHLNLCAQKLKEEGK